MLTPEDRIYLRKIEEMANERLRFFRDRELDVVNNKSNKRQRSTTVKDSDHHQKKKKTKVAVDRIRPPVVVVSNETTERLKNFIVNVMNGTDVKLVIQKMLYKSDTDPGLNRLSMPTNQLVNKEFLRADERGILHKTNPKENEIEVSLLGPTLDQVYPMKLKLWHIGSRLEYVLMSGWIKFWKKNKMCMPISSIIQVWSFRTDDDQLCFAVTPVA